MSSIQHITVTSDSIGGLPDEIKEQLNRSLRDELCAVSPGSAEFARQPGSQSGAKSIGITDISLELTLSMISLASTWIIPLIQHWLVRQHKGTVLRLRGEARNGDDVEVVIDAQSAEHLIEELKLAISDHPTSQK